MAGYECKFVYPLPEILECPFCHRALRNPVQAECGHRYCKDCVESILQKPRPICPLDNEEIFQVSVCGQYILLLLAKSEHGSTIKFTTLLRAHSMCITHAPRSIKLNSKTAIYELGGYVQGFMAAWLVLAQT